MNFPEAKLELKSCFSARRTCPPSLPALMIVVKEVLQPITGQIYCSTSKNAVCAIQNTYIQTTFVYLGRFLKKLADDQICYDLQ